jgi:hypothetical protein
MNPIAVMMKRYIKTPLKYALPLLFIGALVLVSISGCTSPATTSPSPSASSATAQQAKVTPSPTSEASPTPTPTAQPTTTPSATKVATEIDAYVPPSWYKYGLISDPEEGYVTQGQPYAVVEYGINAADGTHPCGGAANFYIDGQAAGGVWRTTPNPNPFGIGCGANSFGGAGELTLYASDTAKLSVGAHTLRIQYLGIGNYAPSFSDLMFYVVAPMSTPVPTPTPTPFPTATPIAQLA